MSFIAAAGDVTPGIHSLASAARQHLAVNGGSPELVRWLLPLYGVVVIAAVAVGVAARRLRSPAIGVPAGLLAVAAALVPPIGLIISNSRKDCRKVFKGVNCEKVVPDAAVPFVAAASFGVALILLAAAVWTVRAAAKRRTLAGHLAITAERPQPPGSSSEKPASFGLSSGDGNYRSPTSITATAQMVESPEEQAREITES